MNETLKNRLDVEQLPVKQISIGGVKKSVFYDEENSKIYGTDDKGRWNGTVKDIKPLEPDTANDNEQTTNVTGTNTVTDAETTEGAMTEDTMAQTQQAEQPQETPDQPPLEEQNPQVSNAPAGTHMKRPTLPTDDIAHEMPQTMMEACPGNLFDDECEENEEAYDHTETPQPTKRTGLAKKLFYAVMAVALVLAAVTTVKSSLAAKGTQDPSVTEPSQAVTEPTNNSDTVMPEVTGGEAMTSPVQTEPVQTEPLQTEPVQTEPVQTEPLQSETTTTVKVIVATNVIIPGEEITENTLEIREIPENDYRLLSAAVGLYTDAELDKLTGLVATNYIPAGKYLSYSDLGRTFGSVNPWEGEYEEYKRIAIPVSPTPDNLTGINWASTVSLTITVQTKQTNENTTSKDEEEGSGTPDGMEHESSVLESMVVDTYRLSNVWIADIQNAAGESLYARYYAISSIPSAFQVDYLQALYQDETQRDKDIPAFIIICVTDAQYELLSGIPHVDMTVEVSNSVFASGTMVQNETYAMLRDAEIAIAEAWKQAKGE